MSQFVALALIHLIGKRQRNYVLCNQIMKMMKEFWNDRYSSKESAYGFEPNAFIKSKLPLIETGKILFPAEGEGRNAVYAAQLGWDVSAFDYSRSGKQKAEQLAKSKNVKIDYCTYGFLEEDYPKESFDAICNVFVHFEPSIKTEMHNRLDAYLKKGGLFILEAFSKEHRIINEKNPKAGGPPDEKMMYSIDEIKQDFKNYDIIELEIEKVHLEEGLYHVGESSVLRFLGRKK